MIMFRQELLLLFGTLLGILILVGGIVFWVDSNMGSNAKSIATEILPAVIDTGTAVALTHENWARVQLLLDTDSTAKRLQIIGQIRTNSNESLWSGYGRKLSDPEARVKYEMLLLSRMEFVSRREQFFGLVTSNRLEEARTLLDTQLSDGYTRYSSISRLLFESEAKAGRRLADSVIGMAKLSPPLLVCLGILVFGLGLLLGLRGAFTGLDLASEFGKRRRP